VALSTMLQPVARPKRDQNFFQGWSSFAVAPIRYSCWLRNVWCRLVWADETK